MMIFKAQWDISTWQPCVCFICQIFNTFLIPVGYTLTYFCGSTSAISHVLFLNTACCWSITSGQTKQNMAFTVTLSYYAYVII